MTSSSCVDCGSSELVEDHKQGLVVCTACGVCQSVLFNEGEEWRDFEEDLEPTFNHAQKNRVGHLEYLADGLHATIIPASTTVQHCSRKRKRLEHRASSEQPSSASPLFHRQLDRLRDLSLSLKIHHEAEVHEIAGFFKYLDQKQVWRNKSFKGIDSCLLAAIQKYYQTKKKSQPSLSQIHDLGLKKEIKRAFRTIEDYLATAPSS